MLGLALAALALTMAGAPRAAAGIDDADTAQPQGPWIVQIGPQMTVIVDEYGGVAMIDDPSQQEHACSNITACLGAAAAAVGGILFFGRADIVEGVSGAGERVLTPPGESP
jgi:hypothetical protein